MIIHLQLYQADEVGILARRITYIDLSDWIRVDLMQDNAWQCYLQGLRGDPNLHSNKPYARLTKLSCMPSRPIFADLSIKAELSTHMLTTSSLRIQPFSLSRKQICRT